MLFVRAVGNIAFAKSSHDEVRYCKPPPPTEAPVPVDTAKVVRKTVPDLIEAPGSVEPIDSVAVKSLVDGQLLEAHVKDGDEVKKGDLLFKIDPRPAQAAETAEPVALSPGLRLALAITALGTLVIGIFPEIFLRAAAWSLSVPQAGAVLGMLK